MLAIRRIWPWSGLALVLALASAAYWPGLGGGFLFDDFVNLDALGATGPVDNWPTFWRYITSGTADPTGRPLALLSFLLDARDWPSDPAGFLRTNLLLHLANGGLLFALLRQLGRNLDAETGSNDATALLAAGLWLVHPLFVSTTLYIVQREAMLPTSFTLAGLLCYCHGRRLLDRRMDRSGLLWMVSGIVGGSLMAVLSKGNGVLLPLLAWTLEATVFNAGSLATSEEQRRRLRKARMFLLILPSSLLLTYLLDKLSGLNADLPSRPWTLAQRLLTEPRVLMDYLRLLVVPRSVSTGLYNDSYLVSTSLWQPASTLPAILSVLALAAFGALSRARQPRLAAAILFFLAGHVLESSIIPLELYFEHRNYLPAMLLFWPLAHALCTWRVSKSIRVGIGCSLLILFAATTWQRASLWGKPEKLAALWAMQSPESSRARATQALMMINAGDYERATTLLHPVWVLHPDDLQIAFNYIEASCGWHGLSSSDKQRLENGLRRSRKGELLIHQWLGRAIGLAATRNCQGLALDDVERWIAASASNPAISPPAIRDQTIEPLLGQLSIQRQRPVDALVHFNRALSAFPTPDTAARNASYLASAGYYRQALSHLDYYEQIKLRVQKPGPGMPWLHAKVLLWEGYWPREMSILRGKLAAEIARHPEYPIDEPAR